MGMCVVITGSIAEGMVIHGPFKTMDHAEHWAENWYAEGEEGANYEVVPLEFPEQPTTVEV